MRNIYLVGFMGTGKTAVGTLLARKKECQFLDLDALIELREKRAICDIFSQSGEAYFRRIESKALGDVAKETNFVIACGGGIVLNLQNVKLMKKTGTVICLSATPEVILKRTAGYAHRPLLNVKDPKKQIAHLMKLRAPYYAQAEFVIDTSKLPIEKVAKIIEKFISSKK